MRASFAGDDNSSTGRKDAFVVECLKDETVYAWLESDASAPLVEAFDFLGAKLSPGFLELDFSDFAVIDGGSAQADAGSGDGAFFAAVDLDDWLARAGIGGLQRVAAGVNAQAVAVLPETFPSDDHAAAGAEGDVGGVLKIIRKNVGLRFNPALDAGEQVISLKKNTVIVCIEALPSGDECAVFSYADDRTLLVADGRRGNPKLLADLAADGAEALGVNAQAIAVLEDAFPDDDEVSRGVAGNAGISLRAGGKGVDRDFGRKRRAGGVEDPGGNAVAAAILLAFPGDDHAAVTGDGHSGCVLIAGGGDVYGKLGRKRRSVGLEKAENDPIGIEVGAFPHYGVVAIGANGDAGIILVADSRCVDGNAVGKCCSSGVIAPLEDPVGICVGVTRGHDKAAVGRGGDTGTERGKPNVEFRDGEDSGIVKDRADDVAHVLPGSDEAAGLEGDVDVVLRTEGGLIERELLGGWRGCLARQGRVNCENGEDCGDGDLHLHEGIVWRATTLARVFGGNHCSPGLPGGGGPIRRSDLMGNFSWRWLVVGSALALVVGLALIFGNPDAVHHDDDLTHYQMAAWSFAEPGYLLDSWGRPGFTVPYALAAQAGWVGAKIFSLLLALATAWLTALIARELGLRDPWLAGLLLLAQPLFFRLAQTTLTETPAAFYLAAALFLFFRGHLGWASLVFGLQFITRHELIAFAPIWAGALWLRRSSFAGWIGACAMLPVAMLVVNGLSAVFGLNLPAEIFTTARANLDYGTGTPLAYAAGSAVAFGAFVMVLALFGVARVRETPWLALIILLAACSLGVQTVLRTLNLFATAGYPRFIVTIGPLIALLALAGFDWWRTHPRWAVTFPAMWAAALAAVVLMAAGLFWESNMGSFDLGGLSMDRFWVLYWTIFVQAAVVCLWLVIQRVASSGREGGSLGSKISFAMVMLAVTAQWAIQQWPAENQGSLSQAKEAVAWVGERLPNAPTVLSTDPWVRHYLGTVTPHGEDLRSEIRRAETGSVFVLDTVYGPGAAFRMSRENVLELRAMTEVGELGWVKDRDGPRFIVFQIGSP